MDVSLTQHSCFLLTNLVSDYKLDFYFPKCRLGKVESEWTRDVWKDRTQWSIIKARFLSRRRISWMGYIYRLCNLKLDTTFIAADVYQCLSSVKSFKVDLQRNCSPRLSFIISLSMQIDRWRRSKINDRVTKAPSAIATAQGLFAFWNHPNGLLMSVPQCKEVRSVNMWCCARQAVFFSSMLFFQWSILQKQRFFLRSAFFQFSSILILSPSF